MNVNIVSAVANLWIVVILKTTVIIRWIGKCVRLNKYKNTKVLCILQRNFLMLL